MIPWSEMVFLYSHSAPRKNLPLWAGGRKKSAWKMIISSSMGEIFSETFSHFETISPSITFQRSPKRPLHQRCQSFSGCDLLMRLLRKEGYMVWELNWELFFSLFGLFFGGRFPPFHGCATGVFQHLPHKWHISLIAYVYFQSIYTSLCST